MTTDDVYEPVEAVLTAWIDRAYEMARLDETDPHTLEALQQIRHLYLAGDLIPTVVAAYKAAQPDRTPWSELVAATVAMTEAMIEWRGACDRYTGAHSTTAGEST